MGDEWLDAYTKFAQDYPEPPANEGFVFKAGFAAGRVAALTDAANAINKHPDQADWWYRDLLLARADELRQP